MLSAQQTCRVMLSAKQTCKSRFLAGQACRTTLSAFSGDRVTMSYWPLVAELERPPHHPWLIMVKGHLISRLVGLMHELGWGGRLVDFWLEVSASHHLTCVFSPPLYAHVSFQPAISQISLHNWIFLGGPHVWLLRIPIPRGHWSLWLFFRKGCSIVIRYMAYCRTGPVIQDIMNLIHSLPWCLGLVSL